MVIRLLRQTHAIYKNEGFIPLLRGAGRFINARTPNVISSLHVRLIQLRHSEKTVVREINGIKMKIRMDDAGIHRDLLLSGIREPASTKMYQYFLSEFLDSSDQGIFVFDIGANIGYYTLLEASIIENQGQIVAVEPESTNVKDLRDNIALNGFKNVEVHQKAIGSENGMVSLQVSQKGNLHQVVSDTADSETIVSVDMTSIDELVEEYEVPDKMPTVVRIDVEGYEKKVIDGMTNLLRSDRPLFVFLEIHSNKISKGDEKSIIESLESYDLHLKFVSNNGGKTGQRENNYQNITQEFSNKHLMAVRW